MLPALAFNTLLRPWKQARPVSCSSPVPLMSDSQERGDEYPQDKKHGADILANKVLAKSSLHPSLTEDDPEGGEQVTSNDRSDLEQIDDPQVPQSVPNRKGSSTDAHTQTNGGPRPPRPSAWETQRKHSIDENTSFRQRRQGSVSRRYKRTACFVHSLLEVQQRFERSSLSSIPASETSSRSHSPTGQRGSAEARENREAEKNANDSKRDLFTHLSKKEISDMALGVRELSKHLGSARLKLNIHHILIVTKTGDMSLIKLTRDITAWLLAQKKGRKEAPGGTSTPPGREERSHGYTVYVENTLEDAEGMRELRDSSHPGKLRYWTAELCTKSPHLFDFVVTLGGDGTVLYTSWLFQRIVPPVLSFALGSLGFMTMFDFQDHENVIKSVLQDGVTAALRMRIECTVYRANRGKDGKLINDDRDLHADLIMTDHDGEDAEPTHSSDESFSVLNDLVVDRGPNAFMSSTELYGDDEHLTSIAADGVVISTPTGSTAYSLSAGGSLCHPEIPAILVSPICPHTLSFRPLLVPDSMVLRVAVPYDSRSTAWASFDGRNRVELKQGDYVRISASRFPFPTCLRGKQTADWFESVSRTLNWNERKKQHPLD